MWDFVMDKSCAGAGFLREVRFPLPIYIPSASPQSSSLSPVGWHNRPGVAAVPIDSQPNETKRCDSGLENRDWRQCEFVALTTQHPVLAKVGTTSPTSGGRSVGIVRLRTRATFFFVFFFSFCGFIWVSGSQSEPSGCVNGGKLLSNWATGRF
jgi:hypothetical protein